MEAKNIPLYQCHKKVRALKIKLMTMVPTAQQTDDKYVEITPEGGFSPFYVSREWFLKHTPLQGGYYVVYEDDYVSYSPAKAFEDGYTLIEQEEQKW
jgi:hypothetical protein